MKNLFEYLLLFWTLYISSNIMSMLLAVGSYKFPSVTRLALFLLFGWGCWMNVSNAIHSPWAYVDYADSALLPFKNFVLDFKEESLRMMAFILALAQMLIAISMLLKGNIFKAGCLAGILFCLLLIPLGLYSGFPAPILMALTFYMLFIMRGTDYLWAKKH